MWRGRSDSVDMHQRAFKTAITEPPGLQLTILTTY